MKMKATGSNRSPTSCIKNYIMASLSDYQVKLLQLHTRLSRLNTWILNYLLKMIVDNHDLPSPIGGKDRTITISDLRDSLLDSNNDQRWMDYFSEMDARIASKKYKPGWVIYLFKSELFERSIFRFLHSAHALLLGLAMHLSGTIGAGKHPSGLASMKVNLLNRKDPNVLLVLEAVRDINECVEHIDLIDQPKIRTGKAN